MKFHKERIWSISFERWSRQEIVCNKIWQERCPGATNRLKQARRIVLHFHLFLPNFLPFFCEKKVGKEIMDGERNDLKRQIHLSTNGMRIEKNF